jgi:glycosyltransferase involved in cell wall biosynthesis
MKLTYIFNREITSDKASLVQSIYMCDAFASQGIDVEMSFPTGKEKIDVSNGYLSRRFGIKNEFNLSFYSKVMLFNRLSIIGSYFGIKKFLKENEADLYFTRCPMIFTQLASKKLPVIYEAHNSKIHNKIKLFDRYWARKVLEASHMDNCLLFITISKALSDYWEKKGVPIKKLLPLHDGFSNLMFKINTGKIQARSQLNIQQENKIVTYTGSLYPDREIENIIKLAKRFPGVLFIVVGGPRSNADYFRALAREKKLNNITFTGPVEHSKVPLYLYASDVLLALWSAKVPTINYCSPLKIFEYMAAGRIIIAHGFPTIKEVIRNNENGLLVIPGDFQDLVEKLKIALNSPGNNLIERKARDEAFKKYSWNERAGKIIEVLNGQIIKS